MTAEVTTAEASGNTNPSAFRGRAFQLTLNEVEKYDDLKSIFKGLKSCDYFISCLEEAPTTGHKHIHIYTHFTQSYKISKKILKIGAHIEICKGSPKQNIEYIRKDGNILDEWGEEPHQGKLTVNALKEMDAGEVSPFLYRIKKEIDNEAKDLETFMEMLGEIERDELKAPTIIYITGRPGKGKTYSAYKRALKDFKKEEIGKLTLNNNFIDITNKDAKCFVIEEFRPSQIKASDFLQLTDKYGYRANIKGGFMTLRPEEIIICSVIDPTEIYKDELNEQFLRRITEIINYDVNDAI